MSKAANIYWDKGRTGRPQAAVARGKGRGVLAMARTNRTPGWVAGLIVVLLSLMVVITVNYRSFSNLGTERQANRELESAIEVKTQENLELQEEIHYLRNDAATVQREAKKFGLAQPEKQNVLPPAK